MQRHDWERCPTPQARTQPNGFSYLLCTIRIDQVSEPQRSRLSGDAADHASSDSICSIVQGALTGVGHMVGAWNLAIP